MPLEECVQQLSAVFGDEVVEEGLRRLQQAANEIWSVVRLNEDQLFFQMSVRLSDRDMSPLLRAYVQDTVRRKRNTSVVAHQKWWECPAGMLVHESQRLEDIITSVCVKPDNKRVVYGTFSGNIRVWDVESGKNVGGPMEGHTATVSCLTISDDGRYVVSGSIDGTVRTWGVKPARIVLKGHKRVVTCVAVSRDNKYIASGSVR